MPVASVRPVTTTPPDLAGAVPPPGDLPGSAPSEAYAGDAGSGGLAVAAAAVTLLLWASAFVVIRHLGDAVSPGALSLGRLGVAALAIGALLVVRRGPRRWPARRHALLVGVCGVAWFGVYNIALNAAEQRIDAGTAALVVQVGPIIVALLSAVFLGEPLHRWLLVGMGVGFAGVVVIGQSSSGSGHGNLLGVVLAAVAAVTYAVGVLCQKPVLSAAGALETTFVAVLIGAVVCLPWSLDLAHVVTTTSADTVLWIVYLGLFPTAIAFTTWAYALSRTKASTMALSTFLVPFLASGMAWAALAEVPAPLAFVGGALCIVGVVVSRRRPPARAVPTG